MQDRTPYKHNTMQNYKEIWKDIPNYEGMYQVSNLGRVKSLKFGKERTLKPGLDGSGYCHIVLCKGGVQKDKYIHRLVLLTFVGESELQVNHKNGVKTDNRLENLEYCTRSENAQHAFDTGLNIGRRGEKNSNSKLTRAFAERIKYGHQGMTQKDIAEIYGIARSLVSDIRLGKLWKHI